MIREVMRFRDLLYMMVWRDIRIKYKQSILGVLWAVLMPATIVLAGVVVKLRTVQVSGKPLRTQDLANVSVRAVPGLSSSPRFDSARTAWLVMLTSSPRFTSPR